MSRIPVSHKNRIRGETRDRIRSELNISESINSHINDFNNPHSVTKSQVGLSEVDNTSDANKPVSTAQQAALDLKEDISALGTAAYADLTTSTTDPTVGRVLKVGDVIDADTVDGLNSTQFIRSDMDDTTAGKLGVGGYISPTSGAFLQVKGFQRTGTIYLHPSTAPTTGSVGVVLQNVSGALVWDSNTVHHSGNTNLYEFITNNIGERLLEGVAISTTEVDCALPTSSFTYPASLTAVGGYNIIDSRAGAVRATNVLPVLSPISTPKVVYARFTVVGAVVGKRHRIVAATTNSKITVNF
jgi:hypothetical protein